MLTPVVLACMVAGAPDRPSAPVPMAAPSASAPSAPAPGRVGPPVAGLRLPGTALSAFHRAERTMATAAPGCGMTWNLLAGISRIERTGSTPAGTIRTVQARTGSSKGSSATWLRFAADGDGDGRSDPVNPFDATLATARHLCSSGLNFRNQTQALAALLRYNNSMAFAQNVLGWAAAYATGSAPLNLPPIYGPVPVYRPRWDATQRPLVPAQQMLVGPVTPVVAPAQSAPPPAAPPPVLAPAADPVPAPVVNSRPVLVMPPSHAGDRPKPVAAPPVKVNPGRQSVRVAASSPPQPTAQSAGSNDSGGKAGGTRRAQRRG